MTTRRAGRHRRTAPTPSARRAGRAAVTAAVIVAATVSGVHLGTTAAAVTPVSTVPSHVVAPMPNTDSGR